MFSPSVDNLVAQLTRLPGVGQRTAQRLAFHLLRVPKDEAGALAAAKCDTSAVTTTEFEALPSLERAEPRTGTLVMKFGGTSVADAEKLKNVARRLVAAHEAGARVVAVLSAMGQTTDELLDLADRKSVV